MRLYEPYLAQWPGLSQRPSPAKTNLKMRQKKHQLNHYSYKCFNRRNTTDE